jgi:hypothetical protein
MRLGTRLLTASSRDAIPSKLVDKYDTDVPKKPNAFIFLTLKMDAEFFAENVDAYIPDYTTSFIS